jgi:hypothetical protein
MPKPAARFRTVSSRMRWLRLRLRRGKQRLKQLAMVRIVENGCQSIQSIFTESTQMRTDVKLVAA